MTLFIVSLTTKRRTPTKELEPAFDRVGDWIRLNSTTWIVHTTKSLESVYRSIRAHISDEDNLIVADYHQITGWAPEWIWDWIDERQGLDLE